MATDAQILTARSEYAAACVALKEAQQARVRADNAVREACEREGAAISRKNQWATKLLQLAETKPVEPPPEPSKVENHAVEEGLQQGNHQLEYPRDGERSRPPTKAGRGR